MTLDLTTLSTGAAPQRGARSSQLIFGWESRFGLLNAYTGQPGVLSVPTSASALPVVGRNGVSITAAHGQSRWFQTLAGNIPRLAITSDLGGSDVESYQWPWLLKVMSLSIFVRVVSLYTAGSSQSPIKTVLNLGNAGTGGGQIFIGREGVNWAVYRRKTGFSDQISTVAESGSTTYPIDVLATMTTGGVMQIRTRDSAATPVLATGAASAGDGNMAVLTDSWAGNLLYSQGGQWYLETIKIARGALTFAQMDLLS